jgi:ABC-2 type transport system ATP-binding protein
MASGTRAKSALEARGLSKSYGERVALREVDLSARRGELLAVVGPNGAGKTTMLGILAGIIEPDAGEVEAADGAVGWVPQQAALYRRLTVAENLRLFARLEGAQDPEASVDAMLAETGLEERRDDQVSSLSSGNQQRINIAIGLLAEPAVLLLDEPSAGLDPGQRIRLWEFVAGLAKGGTTVIYSTHQIEEASHYGDRLLVLADGDALFDGTFPAMRRAAGLRGRTTDPEADFVRFLKKRGH